MKAEVVRRKLTVLDPAAALTEAGSVNTSAGMADKLRTRPPAGAGPESAAVQVVDVEGNSEVLPQARDDRMMGALMVRVTALLELLRVDVIVEV